MKQYISLTISAASPCQWQQLEIHIGADQGFNDKLSTLALFVSPDPTTVKIDEATKYILRTVHPTHYDKKSKFAHEVNRLL